VKKCTFHTEWHSQRKGRAQNTWLAITLVGEGDPFRGPVPPDWGKRIERGTGGGKKKQERHLLPWSVGGGKGSEKGGCT